MGVVRSTIDCSSLQPIQVPDSDMGSHFGMLLENMEGSDVVFSVAGEKFHAHKLVLTARSPVFRAELFDELMGDKQEIVVTDMEPRVFKVSIDAFFLSYFVNHFILNWVSLCCRRRYIIPSAVALLHLSCCICFSKVISMFWQKKIKKSLEQNMKFSLTLLLIYLFLWHETGDVALHIQRFSCRRRDGRY